VWRRTERARRARQPKPFHSKVQIERLHTFTTTLRLLLTVAMIISMPFPGFDVLDRVQFTRDVRPVLFDPRLLLAAEDDRRGTPGSVWGAHSRSTENVRYAAAGWRGRQRTGVRMPTRILLLWRSLRFSTRATDGSAAYLDVRCPPSPLSLAVRCAGMNEIAWGLLPR
jgi:hypothetical protein